MSNRDPSPPAPEELLAHADFVRALSRRLLDDTHRAEDVVQETWLAAIRKPPKPERSLGAWLSGVVRNLAAKARRREARRERRKAEAPPGRQPEDPAELRGRLDERHGFDRGEWRGLLLPFVFALARTGAPLVSTTSKLAAAAAILLLAGTAGIILHDPPTVPRKHPAPARDPTCATDLRPSTSTVDLPRPSRSDALRPAQAARETRVLGTACGRVRFRDGRAPQDALVVLERLYRDGDDPGGPTRFELATGPEGDFRLEELPPGPYRIAARDRGGHSGEGRSRFRAAYRRPPWRSRSTTARRWWSVWSTPPGSPSGTSRCGSRRTGPTLREGPTRTAA